MKCFYHGADFDGECSAAIIKLEYPDCELIPSYYEDAFDFSNIKHNEKIWIVDFSFSLDKMQELFDKVGNHNITWIDHHKTSIEKLSKFEQLTGYRKSGTAACELTWRWIYPDETLPAAIALLAKYDVWDFHDEETKRIIFKFQKGMSSYETSPSENINFWKELLAKSSANSPSGSTNSLFFRILDEGDSIYRYAKKIEREEAKRNCFETSLEGHLAICVNRPRTNSTYFDDMQKEKQHELCIVFFKTNQKRWYVSLYSETVDVSQIAKKHGGGGHTGAAGFTCDILPFDIGEQK